MSVSPVMYKIINFEIIKKYFAAKDYYLEKFNPASYDDIYFIEINSLNDLDKSIKSINIQKL